MFHQLQWFLMFENWQPGSECRDHSWYGLSQWEMKVYCNVISHWLGPYPEWSLECFVSNVKLGWIWQLGGFIVTCWISEPFMHLVSQQFLSIFGVCAIRWNLYNESGKVLLKAHKFHELPAWSLQNHDYSPGMKDHLSWENTKFGGRFIQVSLYHDIVTG